MNKALIKLIEVITQRVKPCVHDWVLDSTTNVSAKGIRGKSTYTVRSYRCKKCCEIKQYNTN